MRRLLLIGLDGIEISCVGNVFDRGDMPVLHGLLERGASWLLDHDAAKRTGLAWEHFASGMTPREANRWSAVELDPETYEVWQQGARVPCFLDDLPARVVVFDPPYVDLERCTNLRGVVGWGAHDPGAALASRPASVLDALPEYPASAWTYGTPWPSAARCREMGAALVAAIETRTEAALRLMNDELPDWDAFYAVSGELHGAIEGMWHGIDAGHPLHEHPSATAAREALRDIHRALDRFLGTLIEAAGEDVSVLVFNMNGMGSNQSDLPSMVLLPELLYRDDHGRSRLRVPAAWSADPAGAPSMHESASWSTALRGCYPGAFAERLSRGIGERLPTPWRDGLRSLRDRLARSASNDGRLGGATAKGNLSLSWIPATWYRPSWAAMEAFALPSFYDGQVRVNLRGRERSGRVALEDFDRTCDRVEALVRACRDPRTGEPVVDEVIRPTADDPRGATTNAADLLFVWRGTCNAFEHPDHGLIGPIPFRRTGGHTGRHGVAVLLDDRVAAGARGVRSSFDVAPTVRHLLGGAPHISEHRSLVEESLRAQGAAR